MSINIFSEKTAKILSWIGISSIILGAVIFIVFRSWNFSLSISEEKIGQFGDFVGGVVGSIFAFVGVILYYAALTEQRKDIEINRKALETQIEALNQQIAEFKAQTKEMQETRTVYEEQTNLYREQTNYYQQQVKEFKNQTKISSLQHFNSEFYNLLNVFIKNKNECYLSMKNIIDGLKHNMNPNLHSLCDKHSNLIDEYLKQYYNNTAQISIYFKTLYRLLKMIDSSNLEEEQKQRYAKTLRSQLSEIELLVLYYNYYSDFGEKVRMLAIKYNMLKHLNFTDKLEIDSSKFDTVKASLASCLNKISEVFDIRIKQSQDLETENDIKVSEQIQFINISTKYNIEINENWFVFGIELTKEQIQFPKDDYKNLFLMFLYEYFFLSKFKQPIDNVFDKKIIEGDSTFEFNYKTELKNIL